MAETPEPLVGLVMGSDSDWVVMKDASDALDEFGVAHEVDVLSAHRMPQEMLAYGEAAAGRGLKVIIAGAGGAAHLPGMLACGHPAARDRCARAARATRWPRLAALDRADARWCPGGNRLDRRCPQRGAAGRARARDLGRRVVGAHGEVPARARRQGASQGRGAAPPPFGRRRLRRLTLPESTTFTRRTDGSLCLHALRRVRRHAERGRFPWGRRRVSAGRASTTRWRGNGPSPCRDRQRSLARTPRRRSRRAGTTRPSRRSRPPGRRWLRPASS